MIVTAASAPMPRYHFEISGLDVPSCLKLSEDWMTMRFRKSVKLMPGLRLNFSKSGVSTSLGGGGGAVNLSRRGVRSTLSVPGPTRAEAEMSHAAAFQLRKYAHFRSVRRDRVAVHRKKPCLEIRHVVLQSCCFRHGVRSIACLPQRAGRTRGPLLPEPFVWEALRSCRSCAAQQSDPWEVDSADKTASRPACIVVSPVDQTARPFGPGAGNALGDRDQRVVRRENATDVRQCAPLNITAGIYMTFKNY